MTWSSSSPRGGRTEAPSPSHPPVMWAPEELALDTRGLHEALRRNEEDALEPVAPEPDPEFLERAMQEAFERGVAEGRRVGDQEATARLRHAVASVTEALESLHADADRWVGNAEENICALAIAVARQVIGREVVLDKSALSAMVAQAIEEFPVDQALDAAHQSAGHAGDQRRVSRVR